jgi:hypothetical protein
VKNIDSLEYVHQTFVAFSVDSTNLQPEVLLNKGTDFNWCLANGTVPNGSNLPLDITDGYYLVSASTGLITKIVGDSTTVPSGVQKITAVLSSDGDKVRFTSNLAAGGYYLVGKAKHLSASLITSSTADLVAKMRVKGNSAGTEIITNTTQNLNTIKRVVKTNSGGTPYEIYFNLNKADVWKINSITDGSVDISNRFIFDTGQTDRAYELSRLYVKPEYLSLYKQGSSFNIVVNYEFFDHTGYGPFTVESYRGISYDNIPVYTSPSSGVSIPLASAMDFRFVARIDGSSTKYISYSNGIMPDRFTLENSYRAYLPRIDKLVINANISADGDTTTLSRVEGVPSESPVVPEDLRDSMTISVLSIPAYTFDAGDVKSDSIGNSRYTMKDIGDISNRVNDLEQYAVLNELELGVIASNLKNSSGEDAIKKAIVADVFDGHVIGDVSDRDHRWLLNIIL